MSHLFSIAGLDLSIYQKHSIYLYWWYCRLSGILLSKFNFGVIAHSRSSSKGLLKSSYFGIPLGASFVP
jgi:hypothetical protein